MLSQYCQRSLVAFFSVIAFPLVAGKAAPRQNRQTIAAPPVAPVKPVTTDYYATKVVDPYRYMENLKDPKVQAWMKAQNDYTRAVLARIPGREQLLEQIRKFDQSVPRVHAKRLPGDRYLLLKQLPGDNVAKLYVRQGLNGEDKLLVDPGKIKLAPADRGKGKSTISYFSLSQDGRYLAVGITPGGAERDTEIHVIETTSGRETGDVIFHAPAAGPGWGPPPSWLPDNRSFVYGRLQKLPSGAPPIEFEQKFAAYLHALGTDPGKDLAVFGYGVTPTMHIGPRDFSTLEVPHGSRYAVGEIGGVSPNSAFYIEPVSDLGKANSAWHEIAALSDDVTDVALHGDDLYLLTYKNAPRYKVILTDARKPDLASAETVIAPTQVVITGIHAAGDALYMQLLDGGISSVLRVPYGPKPKAEVVRLPFPGAANVETDPRLPGALFGMQSWTKAYRIYAYDPKTDRVINTRLQPMGPYDNPSNIESEEVKAPSYDGTLVPLSIVHLKGMKLDGSNPTLLEGYGAYGHLISPQFETAFLAFYEKAGVYAACHVRGGGAYGEQWHLAGKGPTKPNSWRDFIACAKYLIKHRYTSPAHLAGMGISAGGIVIGRAITSRPDLFAAAIDWSGPMDMLRFETTANGQGNVAEIGSVKTEAGFKALYAMSPYAHVKARTAYPAALLITGMNDRLVEPWELAKMTARLQAATSSGKPVLLRIDYAGGHSTLDQTKTQREEVIADLSSFLLWQLGAPGFQPKN
jgi:prolyl oligopeptidase